MWDPFDLYDTHTRTHSHTHLHQFNECAILSTKLNDYYVFCIFSLSLANFSVSLLLAIFFLINQMEITSTSDRKCFKLTRNNEEKKPKTICVHIEIVTPIVSMCVFFLNFKLRLSSFAIQLTLKLHLKWIFLFCKMRFFVFFAFILLQNIFLPFCFFLLEKNSIFLDHRIFRMNFMEWCVSINKQIYNDEQNCLPKMTRMSIMFCCCSGC